MKATPGMIQVHVTFPPKELSTERLETERESAIVFSWRFQGGAWGRESSWKLREIPERRELQNSTRKLPSNPWLTLKLNMFGQDPKEPRDKQQLEAE